LDLVRDSVTDSKAVDKNYYGWLVRHHKLSGVERHFLLGKTYFALAHQSLTYSYFLALDLLDQH